jgi:hypothetical protein
LKVEDPLCSVHPAYEALKLRLVSEQKGAFMLRNSETIRELDAAELDQVGGGLSLGIGVNLDLSSELNAVSGVLDTVLGAVGGLVGGLVGGVVGGATGG